MKQHLNDFLFWFFPALGLILFAALFFALGFYVGVPAQPPAIATQATLTISDDTFVGCNNGAGLITGMRLNNIELIDNRTAGHCPTSTKPISEAEWKVLGTDKTQQDFCDEVGLCQLSVYCYYGYTGEEPCPPPLTPNPKGTYCKSSWANATPRLGSCSPTSTSALGGKVMHAGQICHGVRFGDDICGGTITN